MTKERTMRCGLSLVELLVGLVVFTLAFLPIVGLFQGQTRQVGLTRHHLMAQEKAHALLEGAVDALILCRFQTPPPGAGEEGDADAEGFRGRLDASSIADAPGLWTLRATVRWAEERDGRRFEKELVLGRLLSDPEGGRP